MLIPPDVYLTLETQLTRILAPECRLKGLPYQGNGFLSRFVERTFSWPHHTIQPQRRVEIVMAQHDGELTSLEVRVQPAAYRDPNALAAEYQALAEIGRGEFRSPGEMLIVILRYQQGSPTIDYLAELPEIMQSLKTYFLREG